MGRGREETRGWVPRQGEPRLPYLPPGACEEAATPYGDDGLLTVMLGPTEVTICQVGQGPASPRDGAGRDRLGTCGPDALTYGLKRFPAWRFLLWRLWSTVTAGPARRLPARCSL